MQNKFQHTHQQWFVILTLTLSMVAPNRLWRHVRDR